MDEIYRHQYQCLDCEYEFEVEHKDDFLYMDECPQCGSDELSLIDIKK